MREIGLTLGVMRRGRVSLQIHSGAVRHLRMDSGSDDTPLERDPDFRNPFPQQAFAEHRRLILKKIKNTLKSLHSPPIRTMRRFLW